jgi:hypothetical protein
MTLSCRFPRLSKSAATLRPVGESAGSYPQFKLRLGAGGLKLMYKRESQSRRQAGARPGGQPDAKIPYFPID